MSQSPTIVRVAVPAPLSRCFDYLLPDALQRAQLRGVRAEVPFGRTWRVGVILECAPQSEIASASLKPVRRLLDREPLLPEEILRLLEWASDYYHHPPGEAIAAALPVLLRKVGRGDATAPARVPSHWRLTQAGADAVQQDPARAPLQAKIIACLRHHQRADREQLAALGRSWRQCLQRLHRAGLVEPCAAAPDGVPVPVDQATTPRLHPEQQAVLAALCSSRDTFGALLVEGVTGSGKTEIYLRYAREVVDAQQQVLVIVPEIALTPQLLARFSARFGDAVLALHSGLSDRERLHNWRSAASGRAGILIGTRSSILVPFAALGLIIVDEEHDSSLKQQEGFRYHARDLALVRAHRAGIPIMLGSATPSLETLHNALTGKYRHFRLRQRAGAARPPDIHLLDVRRHPLNDGLALPLVARIRQHLDAGKQVMLFLNRRGYAPTLLCDECGLIVDCRRCDAHMTVHAQQRRMRCHHCGAEWPVPTLCTGCGNRTLAMVGQGTERIEDALRALFPEQTVVRIDRDTTRRRGALQTRLEQAHSGAANILVGTQMLAKGHHFPQVTLVAILDADRGLFGVDFRAAEKMAQTIVQVAGRAGRAASSGEVIIQTRNPDNLLYQTLIHRGYHEFARTLLEERRALSLPPYSRMVLLRAEATAATTAKDFLQTIRARLADRQMPGINLLGPAAAPVERVAGRYRAQLLLSSSTRKPLHTLTGELREMLETMREGRRVRWSLDVDPADLM